MLYRYRIRTKDQYEYVFPRIIGPLMRRGAHFASICTLKIGHDPRFPLQEMSLTPKPLFSDTTSKAVAALKKTIEDDDKSANAIENLFNDEHKRFYDKGTAELERVLEDAPVKGKGSKFFKEDDCANTKDDPDDPTDEASGNIQTQPAQASGPGPKIAPYAPGTCTLKLKQTKIDKSDSEGEYRLEPQILDQNGASIGYTQPDLGSSNYPMKLQSKLEDMMIITPENQGGNYVQFQAGAQAWPSNKKDGVPSCTTTDWGKDDGQVGGTPLDTNDKPGEARDIACPFVCNWGGGKSSDGTN